MARNELPGLIWRDKKDRRFAVYVHGEPLISLYVRGNSRLGLMVGVCVCLWLAAIPSLFQSVWLRNKDAEPWTAAPTFIVMSLSITAATVLWPITRIRLERIARRRLAMLPEFGGRSSVCCEGMPAQVMEWLGNLGPTNEDTVFAVSRRPLLLGITVSLLIGLWGAVWEGLLGMKMTLAINAGFAIGLTGAIFALAQSGVSYRVRAGRLIKQRHGLFSREYRPTGEIVLAGAHLECLLGQKKLVIRWPSDGDRRESINLACVSQPIQLAAAVTSAVLCKDFLAEELRFPWSEGDRNGESRSGSAN